MGHSYTTAEKCYRKRSVPWKLKTLNNEVISEDESEMTESELSPFNKESEIAANNDGNVKEGSGKDQNTVSDQSDCPTNATTPIEANGHLNKKLVQTKIQEFRTYVNDVGEKWTEVHTVSTVCKRSPKRRATDDEIAALWTKRTAWMNKSQKTKSKEKVWQAVRTDETTMVGTTGKSVAQILGHLPNDQLRKYSERVTRLQSKYNTFEFLAAFKGMDESDH